MRRLWRRLLERLRRWELRRAYRLVARIELLVDVATASELRVSFATQTVGLIDGAYKRMGLGRQDRKRLKNRMVRGRA